MYKLHMYILESLKFEIPWRLVPINHLAKKPSSERKAAYCMYSESI